MSYSEAGFFMMGVNLTKDCVVKPFESGHTLLEFVVARNRSVKKGDVWEEEVDFFECKYWLKNADKMAGMLKKGQSISIWGDPRQERWEKNGEKRSKIIFNVSRLVLPPTGGKVAEPESNDNF